VGITAQGSHKIIGVTPGDAAGVGPEIIAAALASGKLPADVEFRVIGKPRSCKPGQNTPATAQAALDALEEAAWLALSGEIAGVVTGPIHKAAMQQIGFPFPGQTEFFAARCGIPDVTMCLSGNGLTVGLVTAHIPLRNVPDAVTHEAIVRSGRNLAQFIHKLERRPARIAVAGLNPHAGESGMLGAEDAAVIAPAVETLNRLAISQADFLLLEPSAAVFTGPIPPDTVFHRAVAGEFDAVLAMYHDQGLAPLKLHAFYEGVNITIGLPYPRTSPDHGTAFDIAGKGIARPDSMIAAMKLAARLA